jgi:4-amino-4-deoxy-L-arabinose transferase-like glycosyltransferase
MKKYTVILLVIATGLLFIPGLGDTLFNSKGEPREAVVAMSMLDSGNWILPVSYGADIPYKPPFLAWMIATFSLLFNGGIVNEFTSRLPSALAAMALLIAGWRVVSNRVGRDRAWIMLAVTMTSFEFFRAAIACRVDMVLTAAMVGAIYAIYTAKDHPWRYLWAILLLSVAVLTKGPVGMALPLLAMFIFYVCRHENIWKSMLKLSAMGVASLIIPAAWYYGAAQIGGSEFIDLAIEENIGRLTGTMTYDSHLNPWWYNFVTIVWGMTPWTILIVIGLCYRRVRGDLEWKKSGEDFALLSLVVSLTVIIFYCIPASKRSVYLLPAYPFLAYGASWVIVRLKGTRLMRVSAVTMSIIAVIAPIALIVAAYIKHAPVNAPHGLQWVAAALPVVCGAWWLRTRSSRTKSLTATCVFVYLVYLAYSAAFAPMILNPKSDRPVAERLSAVVDRSTPIYSVIPEDKLIRYYTVNFYLGDRMKNAVAIDSVPADAVILASPLAVEQAGDLVHSKFVIDTLSRRSCDTRRAILMLTPRPVPSPAAP